MHQHFDISQNEGVVIDNNAIMKICITYCLLVFMFSCSIKEQETSNKIHEKTKKNTIIGEKDGENTLSAVNDSNEGMYKFAIIKDVDGYTNIRLEENKNARIIDTLEKGEFFRCVGYKDGKEWQKVSIYKWHKGCIVGYIHGSRVQLVEKLGLMEQKKVIRCVLEKHNKVVQRGYEIDLSNSKDNRQEIEEFNDNQYSPALSILPNYFCQTQDKELLLQFFETLLYSTASCSEEPSNAIGECYICQPEMVLSELSQYKGKKEKEVICNNIEFGFLNAIDKKDKKFKELESKLNKMKDKCL